MLQGLLSFLGNTLCIGVLLALVYDLCNSWERGGKFFPKQ